MEAIVPAGVVVVAGLVVHVAGLVALCVMLARDGREGRRAIREIEAMLDRPGDQAAARIGSPAP